MPHAPKQMGIGNHARRTISLCSKKKYVSGAHSPNPKHKPYIPTTGSLSSHESNTPVIKIPGLQNVSVTWKRPVAEERHRKHRITEEKC